MPLSPKTDSMMQDGLSSGMAQGGMQQGGMSQGMMGGGMMGGGGMGMPSADQEQEIFEQSFTEMAQGLLTSKLPALASAVATFKIIESDIEKGSAVGAFICQRPSGLLYVPVVLTDNALKPLEIMYAKDFDVFLPLTPDWLQEVDRGNIESMGTGVKTPESLYTDVDIRNLVVPPTTGRYSFASAQDLKLPDFLAQADDRVRQKFAKAIGEDKALLKVAVALYGSQTLKDVLAIRTKVAEVESGNESVTNNGMFYIATKGTNKQEFKHMFGAKSPEAMRGVAVKGFYHQDSRSKDQLNRPINAEGSVYAQEISGGGAFRIYKNDGTVVTAFMIPKPMQLENPFDYTKYLGAHKSNTNNRKIVPKETYPDGTQRAPYAEDFYEYIGVTEDGECIEVRNNIIGEMIDISQLKGAAKEMMTSEKSPKAGEKGFFFRNRGGTHFEATQSVTIESVYTDANGCKRYKVTPMWDSITLVVNPKNNRGRLTLPKGERIGILPADFTWVKCKDHLREIDLVHDPRELAATVMDNLIAQGSTPLSVKKGSALDYTIPEIKFTGDRIETLVKIARDLKTTVEDAEEVLKLADEAGYCRVILAPMAVLKKLAAEEKSKDSKSKPPKKKTTVTEEPVQDPNMGGMPQGSQMPAGGGMPQQDPNAMQGGGDPSGGMGGMDPSMMGGGMAPPPSPVDQAVQELQEEVQRTHEEQIKLLQQKLDALQAVSMRANEISQGIPKEMSQAIMAAKDSANGGGQASSMGGADPMASGQDPMAGGQMGGQGMPMQHGDLDPSMMQAASGMGDPSMFDAAAIGSLAEHSSLKELVAQYMPTLEKSVDHIGRILLTLWIKGSELREEMGEESYSGLEDRLKSLFRGLGDLIIRINKISLVLKDYSTPDMMSAGSM